MSDTDYYSLVDTALEFFIEELKNDDKIKNNSARTRVINTLLKLRIETITRSIE